MTLSELLALLRKHLALVIALPIGAGIVVFLCSLLMPNQYTASTSMYVLSRAGQENEGTITQSELSAGQMLTSDVSTLIKSDRIQNDVAQTLGLANLKGYKLNVTSSTTTRVITLQVTGEDPDMAANVANEIVKDVSKVAQDVMQIQSVNMIDSATSPTAPSGPRRLLYGAVGAMGGLFAAIAILVIADSLDVRVRNGEEVEEIVGVPVVGHFPMIER